MPGLNRSWLKRREEFFVESPINFLTAIIWFLRKFENGGYCILPHVIGLMQVAFEKLFTVLRTENEIEAYIGAFIIAIATNSLVQLEGQLDAAKIGIARLSSPVLYYALSGNDFSLDINNPKAPKLISLGRVFQLTAAIHRFPVPGNWKLQFRLVQSLVFLPVNLWVWWRMILPIRLS
jgi:hypothetical protein